MLVHIKICCKSRDAVEGYQRGGGELTFCRQDGQTSLSYFKVMEVWGEGRKVVGGSAPNKFFGKPRPLRWL